MSNKQPNKIYKILIVVFLIVVACLYFLIYVADGFSERFIETYTAEYGTMDVDLDIDYLCVRNERVHTADNSGDVKRVVSGGRLMRISSRIADVGSQGYFSQIRGVVSYVHDGLETKYTPEGMKDLKIDDLTPTAGYKDDDSYVLHNCPNDTASTGDVIFKIVDNKAWYLVTWLSASDLELLNEGSKVTIELNDSDKTKLDFKIYYIEKDESTPTDSEKKYEVILSCDKYYSKFARLRYGKARLIITSKTGIILDTSSIVEEDGMQGVYVENKYGKFVFTPIKVIDVIDDKTIVESRTFYDENKDIIYETVKNYDSVKKER